MARHVFASLPVALLAMCGILSAAPALAQGEILITQANALAGNVTPGDFAGFPVTLSLPGSYKLADNLSPGPNLPGIGVSTPDVTIDLNGFRMSGGPAGGANNATHGIVGQGDRLTVKNGTIGGFRLSGIWAKDRHYLIVENIRIVNSGYGIYNSGGDFARIQNSTIATNPSTGIVCRSICHVEGSVVSNNGLFGIQIQSGTVLGNTIFGNVGVGIDGLALGLVGYGNNTLIGNNSGGNQTGGTLVQLHPNYCFPGC